MVAAADYAMFNTFRCAPENQAKVVQLYVDIIEQVARLSPGFVSATEHRSVVRFRRRRRWESASQR